MSRKICCLLILSLACSCLSGCQKSQKPAKEASLDFTVVTDSEIPEELQTLIDERKEKPFTLTFSDQAYLYVVKGYGKQNCSGYQITIHDFYKSPEGIYFNSELFGPKEDNPDARESYPYIVIKTEYTDLPMIFADE